MSAKRAPKVRRPPDPNEIIETAARVNRVNTTSPFGSTTFNEGGDGTFTQATEFSPQLIQVFDAAINQALGGGSATGGFIPPPEPVSGTLEAPGGIGGKQGQSINGGNLFTQPDGSVRPGAGGTTIPSVEGESIFDRNGNLLRQGSAGLGPRDPNPDVGQFQAFGNPLRDAGLLGGNSEIGRLAGIGDFESDPANRGPLGGKRGQDLNGPGRAGRHLTRLGAQFAANQDENSPDPGSFDTPAPPGFAPSPSFARPDISSFAPDDFDSSRLENAFFDRQTRLLDPQFALRERQIRQNLLDRGLPEGSEAFDQALTFELDAQNRARGDAALAAVLAGQDAFETDRRFDFGVFADERNFGQGAFERDRGFGRDTFESDRGFGRSSFEDDRNFGANRFDTDRSFGQRTFESDRDFGFDTNVRDFGQDFQTGARAFDEGFATTEADRNFDFNLRNIINQEGQIDFNMLITLLSGAPTAPINPIDVTGAFGIQQQGRDLQFDSRTARNQQNRDFLTDLFAGLFG